MRRRRWWSSRGPSLVPRSLPGRIPSQGLRELERLRAVPSRTRRRWKKTRRLTRRRMEMSALIELRECRSFWGGMKVGFLLFLFCACPRFRCPRLRKLYQYYVAFLGFLGRSVCVLKTGGAKCRQRERTVAGVCLGISGKGRVGECQENEGKGMFKHLLRC